jgi:hypothetical protein
MDGSARRILRSVAKHGEISLDAGIRLARRRHHNHLDQYPLALLLEEGFIGSTVTHTPPRGAEEMREFSLATTLHMHLLQENERGETHYMGIVSRGSMDARNERVFIKAKGALYLDEQRQKSLERLYSFIVGFVAGILVPIISGWIQSHLSLP